MYLNQEYSSCNDKSGLMSGAGDLRSGNMNPYYEYFNAMNGGGFVPNIGEVYEGLNFQRGYGSVDMWELQNGSGIGSALAALARVAFPFLKSGLSFLGRQAVTAAADVAKDAIMGKNVKESAKSVLKERGAEVMEQIPKTLEALKQVAVDNSSGKRAASEIEDKREGPLQKRRIRSSAYLRGGPYIARKSKKLLNTYPVLRKL